MRVLWLAALLPLAGTVGSPSLSAQTVVGLPQRPLPTMQAAPTGAQVDTHQAFDRRPAGAAPTVTATAVSPSEIRITWNAVPGVVGYLVRRNPETTPQLLTPTAITTTELVDKELLPNTTAAYEVWADFGPESPNSPGRSSVVPATTPPPVNPSGFTAPTGGTGGISSVQSAPYRTGLQWNPAPGAAYYTVKSKGQLVYEGTASSVALGVVPEGEHYYDLLAYYGPTGAAIADTSAPARASGNAYPIPNLVATVTGPGEVTVSWGAVPNALAYYSMRQSVDPQTGTLGPEGLLREGVYLGPTSFMQRNLSSGTYRYNMLAKFDTAHKMWSAYGHVTVTLPR